jgi:thiol-disulfide isomerase/thioredoxin
MAGRDVYNEACGQRPAFGADEELSIMQWFLSRWGRTLRTARLWWAASVLVGVATLVAAETEPASQADSAVEVPAPVYVTLMLARDKVVHAELGLDRSQMDALRAAVAKVDQPLWLLRDVPVDKCAKKLEELRVQLRKGVDAALTAEQLQRFEQLVMQARGAKALVAPDVAERLNLSDEQRELFKQIVSETKQGSVEMKKVVAVLSPEQQAILVTMFGKRFDLSRVSQIGCLAPELRGVDAWINSEPLSLAALRGKVVVVHFWAFGCINCVHNLPHYQSWFDKYPQTDLVIIGIHTPETGPERDERERPPDQVPRGGRRSGRKLESLGQQPVAERLLDRSPRPGTGLVVRRAQLARGPRRRSDAQTD